MASYNLSLSVEQETALTSILTAVNTTRAAQNPPLVALTKQDYLQARLNDVTNSYLKQVSTEDENKTMEAYRVATLFKQSQVKTTLGL